MTRLNGPDKESAHAKARRVKRCIKTPPRERSRLSLKQHNVRDNTMRLREDDEEDFSFQKLRGAVQMFEKQQKNSFRCRQWQKEKHHDSNTDETSITSSAIKTTGAASKMKKASERKENAKENQLIDNADKRITQREQILPLDENQHSRYGGNPEDFSFHALQQRARKLEEKNGGLVFAKKYTEEEDPATEEEDFSFQKLKEKAQGTTMSTPARRQTPSTPRASTPIRTPMGSLSLTPHTTGKFQSSSKTQTRTPIRTPLSSRRVRVPESCSPRISAPMPMNVSKSLLQPASATKHTIDVHKREVDAKKTMTFNPNRYKFTKKIRKEEVQATDETIASVKTLSKWLSDDPFEKKKQVVIRKAEQIANKARAFEHEELLNGVAREKKESRVYSERQHFPQGKVSQGKSWLQGAFGGEGKEDEGDSGEVVVSSVFEKKRLIESACMKGGHRF